MTQITTWLNQETRSQTQRRENPWYSWLITMRWFVFFGIRPSSIASLTDEFAARQDRLPAPWAIETLKPPSIPSVYLPEDSTALELIATSSATCRYAVLVVSGA